MDHPAFIGLPTLGSSQIRVTFLQRFIYRPSRPYHSLKNDHRVFSCNAAAACHHKGHVPVDRINLLPHDMPDAERQTSAGHEAQGP